MRDWRRLTATWARAESDWTTHPEDLQAKRADEIISGATGGGGGGGDANVGTGGAAGTLGGDTDTGPVTGDEDLEA
jgi:hypothetical protein